MPELPEVETIKRGLTKNIVGKIIADFHCDWAKMLNYKIKDYRLKIIDLRIEDVRRRAKMLVLDLSNDLNILIHLKMTGQLVYGSKTKCVVGGHPIKDGYNCLPNKFTHATFIFSDGSRLYFNDVRKFGWLKLLANTELVHEFEKQKLGLEPLSKHFTLEYLKQRFEKYPNKKIKQFLMDAQNVVGIGNIYSDEVCFYAKVSPLRQVKNLTAQEVGMIYQGIIKILQASINAQGTTFSDYRSADGDAGAYYDKLKVYGRYGEKCKVCGNKIEKIKIGGRTSSYCPNCQN